MALPVYWHVLCFSRLFSSDLRTHNTQAKFFSIRSAPTDLFKVPRDNRLNIYEGDILNTGK